MHDYSGAIILSRSVLSSLLNTEDYIEAMEGAFASYAKTKKEGSVGLLHLETGRMEYHIKAGSLQLDETFFGLKVNSSLFSEVMEKKIPKIKGIIVLFEGTYGYPIAILDSIEITIQRTGATTAVAAKYLARSDSRVLTVCGCGNQGKIQLRALLKVLPIEKVYAFDMNYEAASNYAAHMTDELGINVEACRDIESAVSRSDVVTTCTPSHTPYLSAEHIKPGTFIAAVGADSAEKQELDENLVAESSVVVDLLEQSATVGELHHAIEKGLMAKDEVRGEIGDIIAGNSIGRKSPDEIILYDATGTAIQDTAAAALSYRKAVAAGLGTRLNLFE